MSVKFISFAPSLRLLCATLYNIENSYLLSSTAKLQRYFSKSTEANHSVKCHKSRILHTFFPIVEDK